MTEPTVEDQDLVDLTRPRPTPRFRLGPDIFTFAPAIPIGRMPAILRAQRGLGNFAETEDLGPLWTFFALVMDTDNLDRLRARCDSITDPVDHVDLMNVMNHMVEVWGMRPTVPSSESGTTSADGTAGTPSTAGPSASASTATSTSTLPTGATSPTTGSPKVPTLTDELS